MGAEAQGRTDQAIAAYRGGDPVAARAHALEALRLDPDHGPALSVVGLVSSRLGRVDEAIAAYRHLLSRQDDLAAAVNLGNLLLRTGALTEALHWMQVAVRLAPTEPAAHTGLGALLFQTGRVAEAVPVFHRALVLAPGREDALSNLVVALQALGRHREALPLAVRLTRLVPASVQAWHVRGLSLQRLGRFAEALAAYRVTQVLDPLHDDALNNAAAVLYQQNQPRAAATAYRRVLAANPHSVSALNNRALALNRLGESSAAVAALHTAVVLDPQRLETWLNLGSILKDTGALEDSAAVSRHALALAPDHADAGDARLFLLNSLPDVTPRQVSEAHRAWARRHADPLTPAHPPRPQDPQGRRLRVGYVSPDLWTHSVAFFFEPLLQHHDRARFEVFVYSDVRAPDATTTRLQGLAEHWRPTYGASAEEFCAQVRADRLDVLVDLAGHTAENRQLALARKPAPVQATWLGYPNTTGLAAMDWRITDHLADPTPTADALHSERLMRLPGGFLCYRPPAGAPAVAPLPAREKGCITFGSFNALSKMTDDVVASWARVLAAVPGSRLFLKSKALGDDGVRARFAARFAAHGIAPERLTFRGQTGPLLEHLELYGGTDVALDPFPYNGTTTTCEALWMGVPVLTMAGDRHAARVGASLLAHLDLAELIARDPDDLVRRAVALAGDLDRLETLRRSLRPRMQASRLCDAPAFARVFEQALTEMVIGAWLDDATTITPRGHLS